MPAAVQDTKLWLIAAWVVEACRRDDEHIRHVGKCQVDGRTACRAEGAPLHRSAIADGLPMRYFSLDLHLRRDKSHVRLMSGAAVALTLPALTVDHDGRFAGGSRSGSRRRRNHRYRTVQTRSPVASMQRLPKTPLRRPPCRLLDHLFSSLRSCCGRRCRSSGSTKPEWTRRRRVPVSALEG